MSANALPPPERPADRYANLLQRLTGSKQWERSLEVAREWLSQEPTHERAHFEAGRALYELHQYKPAREHLLKTLAREPQNDAAHRYLAVASFNLHDYLKAEEHIAQAISLNPRHATGWYFLAWMRLRLGSRPLAAKHVTHALELQPDEPNMLNLLALCQDPRTPEQLARYRHILALAPDNVDAHIHIGTYQLDVEGDERAAEASFRQALTFDPTSRAAQKKLFLTLRRRDPVYRTLQFPAILANRLRLMELRRGWLGKLGLIAFCLVLGRALFYLAVFWIAFVFPLVKAYEFLTLGDLRAAAGVPGARRGGLFGFRRWPFGVRFGIFVVFAALLWEGIVVGFRRHGAFELPHFAASAIAILVYLDGLLIGTLARNGPGGAARRLEKRFQKRMKARIGQETATGT